MTFLGSLFAPRTPGFTARAVHLRSVLEKVTSRHVSLRLLQYLPVSYYSTNAPYTFTCHPTDGQ